MECQRCHKDKTNEQFSNPNGRSAICDNCDYEIEKAYRADTEICGCWCGCRHQTFSIICPDCANQDHVGEQ